MKVQRTDNSPTNVTLNVSAETAELSPIKRHVLGHFASSVRVPGFRAGKAPLEVIEKHVDQGALNNEFLQHAINELFQAAVRDQRLRVGGEPEVSLRKFVPYNLVEFEATLDVVGPVSLPNYKTIKLAKTPAATTAADVNDVIENLRRQEAERKDVDRAAHQGDEVWIDFDGKDPKGAVVAGASGKDYPLILGSKTFIPGFEENLVGLKPNEDKEFSVTFPDSYGVSALQGKKVSFSVHVNKVQEIILPKVDDVFAKSVGPFSALKNLKADIKKQVQSEKQLQATRDYENQLINKLVEKTKVEIPAGMIEDQLAHMEEEEKQNLTYRGLTWQEHLDQEGITEEEHRDRHRADAESRVKAGIMLSEIAEKEDIKLSPEELEVRMQLLKGQYQDKQMQNQLDRPESRRDIGSRLLTEKTIQRLVEYAGKQL